MNIDDLKPAWKQFKAMNNHGRIHPEEIVAIISENSKSFHAVATKWIQHASLYSFLIVFCQGC
jgi:hypothetical protein